MARGSTGSARKAALRRSRPAETIIASLGGLDPGASATIAIVVVPTTNDPWSATAVVLDYFSDDLAPANNEVTLAIGGATPASPTPGSPVVVSLAAGTDGTRPATLTFSDVTAAGTTTLTTSTTAPPLPAGYEVLGTYYDIQTSASYSGSITLCFSYADPAPTDLLHYENNAWVVVPSVAANRQICGTTTSLSPFALVTRTSPPVLTVPTDLARTADGPTGAVVSYVATAMDYLGKPVTPACSPASGSLFPVGTTKVTCTATDAGGRSSSASFSVTVGYRFAGFFQPLNDPATNPPSVFKSGSTIPVKFALTYTNGTPIPRHGGRGDRDGLRGDDLAHADGGDHARGRRVGRQHHGHHRRLLLVRLHGAPVLLQPRHEGEERPVALYAPGHDRVARHRRSRPDAQVDPLAGDRPALIGRPAAGRRRSQARGVAHRGPVAAPDAPVRGRPRRARCHRRDGIGRSRTRRDRGPPDRRRSWADRSRRRAGGRATV